MRRQAKPRAVGHVGQPATANQGIGLYSLKPTLLDDPTLKT
jgi:hypothetical protein